VGTGCLLVRVRESVTGKPVPYANILAIGLRTGGLADSIGRCVICTLPEGMVAIKTSALAFSPRSDTVLIHRNRTDTLRVELRRLPINASETLWVAPTYAVVPTGSKSGALVVVAADSTTGRPISFLDVTVRRPGWYLSETHSEPEWLGTTDSTGCARLGGIPAGIYDATLCQNSFDRRTVGVEIVAGVTDTLSARMVYLGPPRDGRRCEVRFEFKGK